MKKNRLIKLAFLMLTLVLYSSFSFGQSQRIEGTVLDESGTPLPGVVVLIKGTTTGATTDLDGRYTIEADAESVLAFSYLGYNSEEILVGDKSIINLTMIPDIMQLSDVVVVGYGIQKKETLTGSISNVSGEKIAKSPAPNMASSLVGKLPGLTVNQRSGEPGRDDPNIIIRGSGTYNDNSPLIIIDGVERSLYSRMNPEDIESISVLKDASAAIYGARAGNGVIIITTKKGKKGKPVFNFTHNSAFNRPTKVPEMLDAATFAEVFNEADWYRAGRPTSNYTPFYSDDAISRYRDGSDPVLYPNTNWVDETLKPYAYQQRTNLQVSGGSESINYLLSFGTMNQNGNFHYNPTDYKQYNARFKMDVDITENLNVGANLSTIIGRKNYTPVDTWVNFYNILRANPTIVSRYPNGLIGPGRLQENPMLIDQRGYRKIEDDPIYTTFTASYKIPFVEGLKVDATYNYDVSNQFEKLWVTPYYFHEYNVNTGEYDKTWATNVSTVELTDTYRKWTTSMFNYKITYNKSFNQHNIGAMLGQEQQVNKHSWANAYRKNFVSPAIDQINVGSNDPEDKNNGGSASENSYNNYFGRINYDFDSKYLFEFLFRYDGSPKFPEGKRYGFFPAASAGWRLSEENFMKNTAPFVDELKLRVSVGKVGNDRVGDYQYLQAFSFGSNYVFGGTIAPGIYSNTLPNTSITWEESTKADVGLEASLWDDLFGFDLTFWWEKRENILAKRQLSIPATAGFPDIPDENIGKVDNHGFELVLTHRNHYNDFIYSVQASAAYARSEIVFMDEVPNAELYQNRTGHPVGAALFYEADGIFNTQEELDNYPHQSGQQVGDIKIVDKNGDGEINSQDQFRFDYSATPEITFGLDLNAQYKGFDLTLFFQGQTNAYLYDGSFAALGGSNFDNAVKARAEDRWTVNNPNGTMPRADGFQPGNSTFYLYDATFVRVKTMELGYTIPKKYISKIKLDDLRVYVSGFNMFTWAKEIKWADPEMNGDILYYPQQKVLNFGLNLKF